MHSPSAAVSLSHRALLSRSPGIDGWKREGREVKPGEEPLRTLPARRTSANKKEVDASEDASGRPVYGVSPQRPGRVPGCNRHTWARTFPHALCASLCRLPAEWQTRLISPLPVVDGIVPTGKVGFAFNSECVLSERHSSLSLLARRFSDPCHSLHSMGASICFRSTCCPLVAHTFAADKA